MTRQTANASRAAPPFRGSVEHRSPRPATSRRSRTPDLVIGFEPGSRRLAEAARSALARWVDSWLDAQPLAQVVMAHDVSASPGARLARLRALRDAVERLGVPRENVKYTDLPLNALDEIDAAGDFADQVVLRLVAPVMEGEAGRPLTACIQGAAVPD